MCIRDSYSTISTRIVVVDLTCHSYIIQYVQCAVLMCGHSMCLECLSMMLVDKKNTLSCPQCRQLCNKYDVSYVEDDENGKEESKAPVLVIGSHSTKVQAVLTSLIEIIQQQPQVKVLIFSTVSVEHIRFLYMWELIFKNECEWPH